MNKKRFAAFTFAIVVLFTTGVGILWHLRCWSILDQLERNYVRVMTAEASSDRNEALALFVGHLHSTGFSVTIVFNDLSSRESMSAYDAGLADGLPVLAMVEVDSGCVINGRRGFGLIVDSQGMLDALMAE